MNDFSIITEKLSIGYQDEDGIEWVVKNIDLSVPKSSIFCLVGESGSGKTTLGSVISGTIPPHAALEGVVKIEGKIVVKDQKMNYRGVRGKIVSLIPQNPATALSPYLKVGEQIADIVRIHRGLSGKDALNAVRTLFSIVHLPTRVVNMYPHELSGGMQQRAVIVAAIASNPRVIVADEPTSNLDAVLRGQILHLLRELRENLGITIFLITHDILAASEIGDYISVMYRGRLFEYGRRDLIVNDPRHPYTKLLMKYSPKLGVSIRDISIDEKFIVDENKGKGCPYALRCSYSSKQCFTDFPPVQTLDDRRKIACWNILEARKV